MWNGELWPIDLTNLVGLSGNSFSHLMAKSLIYGFYVYNKICLKGKN
jgi:hypothetical protein